MSWSVGGNGETSVVRASVANAFATGGVCAEPEESIRQAAAKIIDQALESQGYYPNVNVSALGSMTKDYATGKVANSLSISITPTS